ncbi:MAG: DUF6084 family protein [Actinomycetota bacterium]|nr:DUF6084 family protein [Actinomycetota bacterium]
MPAPRLSFSIAGIEADLAAAAPTLRLRLRIEAEAEEAIRGLGLMVRVRIAAGRRGYDPAESERLGELFGPVEQWGRSLGAVPWTEAALNVGPFTHATVVDVPLPCTYDFEVAAAKYLSALHGGDVPLELLFSGTLFYSAPDGRLQVAMIPWDHEATARMPVSVWHQAVEAAFPGTAWLRVRRDVFARLQAHRSRNGLSTWEETLESLLEAAEG